MVRAAHGLAPDLQRGPRRLAVRHRLARPHAARKCTPGKVFEYIACEKPLLSICNEPSDLASQLENWDLPFCGHEDEDAVYEILKLITKKEGQHKADPTLYERKALTQKLAAELNILTKDR